MVLYHEQYGTVCYSAGIWQKKKRKEKKAGGQHRRHKVPPFPVTLAGISLFSFLFRLLCFTTLHSFFFWIAFWPRPPVPFPWAGASFGSYTTTLLLLQGNGACTTEYCSQADSHKPVLPSSSAFFKKFFNFCSREEHYLSHPILPFILEFYQLFSCLLITMTERYWQCSENWPFSG